MEQTTQPFVLLPDLRHYLWGGERLQQQWNKQTDKTPVAESWELAAHPLANCKVGEGPFAGLRFEEYVQRYPALIGSHFAGRFPVLVKLLDTRRSNSIQVHPNDEYATRVEHQSGKEETWLILDCAPEAYVYAGFAHPVSRNEVERRIRDNTLEQILHKMKVKPGDAVHIYAGTVHAIGAGILLAEVQQNSDVTYRLYDYGRRDADGQPRALHLDKALDVATLGPADTTPPGAELLEKSETHEWHRMVRTRGFEAQQLCFEGAVQLPVTAQSFCAVLCLDERGLTARLGSWQRALHKGECLFVPAQQAALRLQGRGRVLLVMLAL